MSDSAYECDRRTILGGLTAGLGATFLTMSVRASGPGFDATVAPPGATRPLARHHVTTLEAAFAVARRDGGRHPFRIWVGRGDHVGQLSVDVPDVHLVGEHRTATRLTFEAASGEIAPDGKHWGTFRTAVLTVRAPGFRAHNLTIQNSFDGIAEMRKHGPRLLSDDPNGPQAVALMLADGSDRAVLDGVDIVSNQDTFFPNAGRTLVRNSRISGSYDFIFGAGTALFSSCEIHSRLRPDPAQVTGYIAAPSTLRTTAVGLVFDRCRLTRDAGVADGSVYLGRPWRPSKQFADGHYGDPDAVGMAACLDCWMDAHISPAGWTEMWYTDKAGDPRHMLQPEDARFCEFDSDGPGARGKRRGKMLTAREAAALLATVNRRTF